MSSLDDIFNRFSYHCLSTEESNNTCIPQILTIGKSLHGQCKELFLGASVAVQYGKRLIITRKDASIDQLQRKDIVEIVDVDPVKNTVMYFGPSEPPLMTPLLFMISYAKKEIQFLSSIYLKRGRVKEKSLESLPHITHEKTFLDLLKSVLTPLQNHESILINNRILLFTAQTEQDMKRRMNEVRAYEDPR